MMDSDLPNALTPRVYLAIVAQPRDEEQLSKLLLVSESAVRQELRTLVKLNAAQLRGGFLWIGRVPQDIFELSAIAETLRLKSAEINAARQQGDAYMDVLQRQGAQKPTRYRLAESATESASDPGSVFGPPTKTPPRTSQDPTAAEYSWRLDVMRQLAALVERTPDNLRLLPGVSGQTISGGTMLKINAAMKRADVTFLNTTCKDAAQLCYEWLQSQTHNGGKSNMTKPAKPAKTKTPKAPKEKKEKTAAEKESSKKLKFYSSKEPKFQVRLAKAIFDAHGAPRDPWGEEMKQKEKGADSEEKKQKREERKKAKEAKKAEKEARKAKMAKMSDEEKKNFAAKERETKKAEKEAAKRKEREELEAQIRKEMAEGKI